MTIKKSELNSIINDIYAVLEIGGLPDRSKVILIKIFEYLINNIIRR